MIKIQGINILNINGKYYKIFDNSLWLLLLRQNSEDGKGFLTLDEAKYSTNDDNRYSILSTINNETNQFRIEGKFEFHFEYPGYASGYNHWAQSTYPLDENDSSSIVSGFHAIHTDIQLKGDNNQSIWKGLSISSNKEKTLLDGTKVLQNWNYAFGCINLYENAYIPTNKNAGTKEELLWMKIPSSFFIRKATYKYLFQIFLKLINILFIITS